MYDKKYLLDDEPVSPKQLIQLARDLDSYFDQGSIFTTSEAALILREHGHRVGPITEISEAE